MDRFAFDDEGVATHTSLEQIRVEQECSNLLGVRFGSDSLLRREKHVAFLLSSLRALPASYVSLDASRPWIAYWCLHALDLLGVRPVELFPGIIDWLARCRHSGGGFCGGAGQAPHSATTYASVLALLVIATPEAYAVIDRAALLRRYLSWRVPGGGFRVQDDGEVDVRGSFTVLVIADLLNILTPQLVDGAERFLLSCQTYEGGFGGEPGAEAHGGYSFCALGALRILQQAHLADLPSLSRWLVHRQMSLEGGFQGRTNKLVDSCYSFWQGATFDILSSHFSAAFEVAMAETASFSASAPPFNREILQKYILCCAQEVDGGLRDKPGKRRDQYHSCYALSGLSIAQHEPGAIVMPPPAGDSALVASTHPLFNIRHERVASARAHFAALAPPLGLC